MSMLPTPNFVTTEAYKISLRGGRDKELPVGSFVRPLDIAYVPKHVTEDNSSRWFMEERDVYCYTHFGIAILPKRILRKA